MKTKAFQSFSVFVCILLCNLLFSESLLAQPNISLWKVDQAHLEDHTTGEAYLVPCGGEYYINYGGESVTEDIIIDILNEGDEDLHLTLPLTLDETSAASYEIITQPTESTLSPNQESHFVVRYTGPAVYQDDKAKINILSDDPDSPTCVFNLDVGEPVCESCPTMTKIFSPDEIGPGSSSTLIFTIENEETDNVFEEISFTDNLPTGMTVADAAGITNSCGGTVTAVPGGSTITFTNGTLGTSSSCTVTVNVTSTTPGESTNTVHYLSSDAGDNYVNANDMLNVASTKPSFTKSFSPASVSLGGRSTLTFTIDNSANTSPIGNLDFTDNLPTGMVIADPPNVSTDCVSSLNDTDLTAVNGTNLIILDANGSTLFSGFEVLSAGATCTVSVDVTTTGIGALENVTNDLLADFVTGGKATATLTSTRQSISLEKEFVDDPTPPGGTVQLDFTLRNFDRSFAATNVAFMDDLTSGLTGLTFNSIISNGCGGTVAGVGSTTISLSGGTIAAEGSCTISVALDVPSMATPGIYTNTTSAITGTIDGSPVVGNPASDELFVEPAPIITMQYLHAIDMTPDPVLNPGDDVIIRYTVTNTSLTSGATDITFLDELTSGEGGSPPDLTSGFLPIPISATLPPTPDPPCGAGSSLSFFFPDTDRQGLNLTGGSLNEAGMTGDACTFDVVVTIPSDMTPGIYTSYTEEVEATVDGANRIGNSASDDLTIIAAPSLSKSFINDPVAPGDMVTLEFTLSNSENNPSTATDITFTDDLAGVLSGLIATGLPISDVCGLGSTLSSSAGETLLTLSGGSLAAGEECTFSVDLTVPATATPGTHLNTTSEVSATIAGGTATSQAASDDLLIQGLKFSKEFISDTLIAGEAGTLRFTIENAHPTDIATNSSFTDNLTGTLSGLMATGVPTENTCGGSLLLSGTTFLTYTDGTVASGTSCTIEVPILVPAGASDGTYTNITSSLSATQSGNPVTIDPATANLTVNSNLIQIDKEFIDDPVRPGETAELVFTITNLDPTRTLSLTNFTDDLDDALTGLMAISANSNTCGGMASGFPTNNFSYSNGSIPAGESCTISLNVEVPASTPSGIYTNTTSQITGTIDMLPVYGDPASDDLKVFPPVSFSKSFDGPTTATGTAVLTFTIENEDPVVDLSGLNFSDDLDDALSGLVATGLPISDVCGTGSTLSGTNFLTMTGGAVPADGSCSFDVTVQVPSNATAGTYTNQTSLLTSEGLTVADTAKADLVIEPAPTFAKSFSPDTIESGAISTLTFTIDNSLSTLSATDLAFADVLPAGLTIATTANATTTCTGGTLTSLSGASTISYSGGSVAASASCTIQVNITSDSIGTFTNTSMDLTSSAGNSGTAMDSIVITCPDTVSVLAEVAGPICEGKDLQLSETGSAAVSWVWTGPNGYTSMMQNPLVMNVPADQDDKTYKVVITDKNGCKDSSSVTIVVNTNPLISVSTNSPVCIDQPITLMETANDGNMWSWTGPNDFSSDAQNPIIAKATSDNGGDYKVIVSDINGCIDSLDNIEVVINDLPEVNITTNSPVCVDQPLELQEDAGDATSWNWAGPNSFVLTNQDSTIEKAQANNGGDYQVIVTDGNGCTDSVMTTVVINDLPIVNPEIVGLACEGSDLILTEDNPNGDLWEWSGPLMYNSSGQNQTIMDVTLAASGIYKVVLTDINGCIDSNEIDITIIPLPVLTGDISGPTVVCSNLTDLPYGIPTGQFTDNYTWAFTGVVSSISSGLEEVTVDNVLSDGTLSVYGNNACGSSIDTLELIIEIGSEEICSLADCLRENMYIDNELLALTEAIDIFTAQNTIISDGTINTGEFKIFRAGQEILLVGTDPNNEFTVELGAVFKAQIQSCLNE